MTTGLQEGITAHIIEANFNEAEQSVTVFCGYNRTDMGNAQRLVALYGDRIRYCAELKEWFIWGGVRWAPDTMLKIRELAKDTVRLIHGEIPFIETGNAKKTKAERKELTAWAYASEANYRLNAMITAAQSDPCVSVKASDFDANTWLINTPDGTIDLRGKTCKLLRHNRDQLLTKVTRGRYNEKAEGGLYYTALFESLSPAEVFFFQRAWGSSLEPTVKNKAMFVLFGRGNSRKSTCSEPPLYALGDYACTQNITTFIKTPKRGGAARPDIVSLEGVHVAYCEETPSGMVFDDATIKSLTSLARQRARTLYQVRERDIELIVTFFIETNELPRIDTTDSDQAEAVFNRLCVITFTNPIAQADVDPNVKQRLITEQELLDAVFTWVIDGYFDYAKNGLNAPDSVKEASESYQLKMNPLAEFFGDEVITDDEAVTPTRDFYDQFVREAGTHVQKLIKNKTSFGMHFSKLAKSKGFSSERTRSEGTVWHGLRIKLWTDEGSPIRDQNKEGDTSTPSSSFFQKSPCNIHTYRGFYEKWGRSCHAVTNASKDSILETDDGKRTDGKIVSNRHINDDLDRRAKGAERRDERGPFLTRNLAAQDILNALNHIRSDNGTKPRSYAATRSIVFTLLTGLERYKQLDGTYFKERFDFCAQTHAGIADALSEIVDDKESPVDG